MASPQKENGYTAISNELLEAVYRFGFTAGELRVLLLVIRYTYGFNRKSANLSASFIAKGTSMSLRYVKKSVKSLVSHRTLARERSSTKITKNYEDWVVPSRTLVPTRTLLLVPSRTPKKDNIKKTYTASPTAPPDGFEEFWDIYPRRVSKKEALKVWNRLSPSMSDRDRILQAVSSQSGSDQWTKDGGRFIPHPATWLNQERWKDDDRPPPTEARSLDPAQLSKLRELGYGT